jgi:hypothetical protein
MTEIKIASIELRYYDYKIPDYLEDRKIIAVMPICLDEKTWRVFYAYKVKQEN